MRRLLGFCLGLVMLFVATSPCAADTIWAEVSEGTVDVYHLGADYNCCWIIEADVVTNAPVIDLFELRGEASGECDCICVFDLHFSFPAPDPGSYQLRVWFAVYPGQDPVLAAELPLEILAGGAGPVQFAQSPCGGWVTGVPEPPDGPESPSFSAIRALY